METQLMMLKKIVDIIKKDGTHERFNGCKIINAVSKSASRVMIELTDVEKTFIVNNIIDYINNHDIGQTNSEGITEIPVSEIHKMVEMSLEKVNPTVCKSYKDYRNYKTEFVHILDDVYVKSQAIRFIGDKNNANTDSALVATKRCLIFNELNKELYRKFFMTKNELEACKKGYIYIHDQSARLDTHNCMLFDAKEVLTGGFEMGNQWYNEPKSLDTFFDVLGDVILATAAQQYGGFTIPEIDKLSEKYAWLSYYKYYDEYFEIREINKNNCSDEMKTKADQYAERKVCNEYEGGWKGIEYKLNTVGSSRGDYPFVTVTLGLSTDRFGTLCIKIALRDHAKGRGKKGHKIPVLFPKYVFLYDENIHGENKPYENVFMESIDCSMKTMYPDYLSMSGDGYIASMYKKYGAVISPMGCRAFLSPWYERGGMEPADENDKPVYVGRFNIGAVSLNLPMILAKANRENKDFYEVLDYYLEMIRQIHIRTYDYLGELRASVNPMVFCEGGCYGGHLDPHDKIKSLLPPMTASFGITALNELEQLYHKKSLVEDGSFALEVMEHINKKVTEFKKEDHILYAIYGTPAESLCALQPIQFKKEFGVIENVSDRTYVSNSFHCHVTEDITPIEKQDKEYRFWELCNGGKIQYVKYPINYNKEAVVTLVRRAMKMGLYEGVNLSLAYCNDCGHEELNMDVCPVCGSKNLTKIDRMNGYLAFSRVKGDTRLNAGKMDEIHDRVSM